MCYSCCTNSPDCGIAIVGANDGAGPRNRRLWVRGAPRKISKIPRRVEIAIPESAQSPNDSIPAVLKSSHRATIEIDLGHDNEIHPLITKNETYNINNGLKAPDLVSISGKEISESSGDDEDPSPALEPSLLATEKGKRAKIVKTSRYPKLFTRKNGPTFSLGEYFRCGIGNSEQFILNIF